MIDNRKESQGSLAAELESEHNPSQFIGNEQAPTRPETLVSGDKPILSLPNIALKRSSVEELYGDNHFLVKEGSDLVIEKRAMQIDESHEKVTDTNGVGVSSGPKSSAELSSIIISILERYRLASPQQAQKPWLAREMYSSLIQEHVELGITIPMVLPAFPFKSPNRTFKVLGHLPDKGEEVAMLHLNSMCSAIKEVYSKGARIDIVSDGLMYNDLLGVSDKEVWTYGQTLRKIAKEEGCDHINFVRLVHLLGESEIGEPLSEEEYLKRAPWFRTQLYQSNIPNGFDVAACISNDMDTTLTYRGYIKFLEKDIDEGMFKNTSMSKRQIKKTREATAKAMIARGRAFAIAIANKFDKSVRLSIHPSTDATKISISLIPQRDGIVMTPWHSALVRSVDGTIHMEHAGKLTSTHDIIFENGRPSYFREKSDLFNWTGLDVSFQYMYPSGILITSHHRRTSNFLEGVDKEKLLELAQICSPIILRGFLPITCTTPIDAGELQCICGYISDKENSGYPHGQANIEIERKSPQKISDSEDCSDMVYQRPHEWTEMEKPPIDSSTSEFGGVSFHETGSFDQHDIKPCQIQMKPAKAKISRWKLLKKWFRMCVT